MIRMVLFAVGFVAITIALVVFQPGSNRGRDIAVPQPVTRAEPGLDTAEAVPAANPAQIPQAALVAPKPEKVAPTTVASMPNAAMDDQSLRKMTWETLSNLNQATGHEKAPGQPGSLLHTIVRRSLNQAPSGEGPGGNGAGSVSAATPDVYVVRPGDSLVSIAEAVYGDVNMTGPLFAANQTLLTRPDDLRPGQTLVLPSN
ncbi:LysM peptidoglycan-binding domain-containing protein [Primorskyibacter sp. 2E233]|uniref:LysM peptidoglycan-binding domain-containing protein n=1 Tax=Primorskyibacter sp. 2E233 TaxID=3413431 RepID=UPI003BF3E5DD